MNAALTFCLTITYGEERHYIWMEKTLAEPIPYIDQESVMARYPLTKSRHIHIMLHLHQVDLVTNTLHYRGENKQNGLRELTSFTLANKAEVDALLGDLRNDGWVIEESSLKTINKIHARETQETSSPAPQKKNLTWYLEQPWTTGEILFHLCLYLAMGSYVILPEASPEAITPTHVITILLQAGLALATIVSLKALFRRRAIKRKRQRESGNESVNKGDTTPIPNRPSSPSGGVTKG